MVFLMREFDYVCGNYDLSVWLALHGVRLGSVWINLFMLQCTFISMLPLLSIPLSMERSGSHPLLYPGKRGDYFIMTVYSVPAPKL